MLLKKNNYGELHKIGGTYQIRRYGDGLTAFTFFKLESAQRTFSRLEARLKELPRYAKE